MAQTITALDLAKRLENPSDAPFVLDVRSPDQFDRWRIEGSVSPDTMNIPYWTALDDVPTTRGAVPVGRETVVVCAYGGSSGMLVELLELDHVVNLDGGMKAWSRTLVPHDLMNEDGRFVTQFDRIAKACLSYAVGTQGATMAVIDPAVDPALYLEHATRLRSKITDVFDTHLHADHVSVARRLADATGATYHISAGDAESATFEYSPLVDGERFQFGDVHLVVRSIATPGHTPGSTSLEVADRFLMTGDAIFVSGVGRPDLGGETEPWARDLFNTIHRRLGGLSRDLEICPAHYSNRAEAHPDQTITRRLGDLLEHDPVVSIDDEDTFVQHVINHLGAAPAVYADIRLVNLGRQTADDDRIVELEVGRNECALKD